MENITYYHSTQFKIIHLKNKPFTYAEHNHVSVYTIGLVLQGKVKLKFNNQYQQYSAPSFFVVAPYQVHSLIVPDSYAMLSICINKDVMLTSSYELFDILDQTLRRLPIEVDFVVLAKALASLKRREISQPIANAILASALSICKSPETNNSVQALAKQTCYSRYHYIKIFKQHIGLTPHKFQIQNRIRKAQTMIENGNSTATIGLDLGFYDQSHFIKYFKNLVGFTPSQYHRIIKHIE